MQFQSIVGGCLCVFTVVACNSSDVGAPARTSDSGATGGSSNSTGGVTGDGGSSGGSNTGGSNAGTGGSSGGAGGAPDAGGGCSVKTLTCADVLTSAALTALQPNVISYDGTGHLPCRFTLPNASSGIFQAFCGGTSLLDRQRATAEQAYPGSVTVTDTIGTKSFEVIVGPPKTTGSSAEVAAVTTSGKYVFDVSMTSAAADIAEVRKLAEAIDTSLSAL
jgi:hypothetical protein